MLIVPIKTSSTELLLIVVCVQTLECQLIVAFMRAPLGCAVALAYYYVSLVSVSGGIVP